MIENKLKFMLENNKLDGLINNKSEAEKLCKLGTTEEVLDLLNKYDYNETKEVFERELLEILQDINLTEEELNKVTGGRISHRQAIAKFLGVVSLAGSINMPTTMAKKEAPASAVAEKKDKNSDWMSHPKEDKLAKTLAGILSVGGIVGVGSLLLYGGKKLFGSSNTDSAQLMEDTSTVQHTTVISNRQTPNSQPGLETIIQGLVNKESRLSKGTIDDIHQEDLEDYAIREFKSWCTVMKEAYNQDTGQFTDPKTWNDNFETLLKIRWAIWLLSVKLNLLTYDDLINFTEGRNIADSEYLNGTVRTEHPYDKKIPGNDREWSAPLGTFWREDTDLPCIGLVCYSLLEIPLILDAAQRTSTKPVLEITKLSKEYFGEHNSPTDCCWETTSYTENENLNEIIQDDADREHSSTESDEAETSILNELADLQAPNENWSGSLEEVNTKVISLIKSPVQNYTDLVKNISADNLKTYAKQGLQLWCDNTKDHYEERLRSITNAEAWNANFGLLVKVRWAVWLMLIKDGIVASDKLQEYVKPRFFTKEHYSGIGNSAAWREKIKQMYDLKPLTDGQPGVSKLDPYFSTGTGNVCFTIWALTNELSSQSPTKKYARLCGEMGTIATKTLTKCMEPIPSQEAIDEEGVKEYETPPDYNEWNHLDVGFAGINHATASHEKDGEKTGKEASALADLARLVAPGETWAESLEKVDSIVVSLIQTPVQDYTDLVKDISSDDLESYAKQGLTLWCENTKKHYDKKTRSITNADTWNANYGLLVKIRWAVWLLLIKEKKVENDILKNNVASRHFDNEFYLGDSGNLAWYEYFDYGISPPTLTNPHQTCFALTPAISLATGNVCLTIWSLTDDLLDENLPRSYTELRLAMRQIATDDLPDCMEAIPLQEDMDEQR